MDQPATRGDIQEVLTTVRELSTRVGRLSEKLDATKEYLTTRVDELSEKLDLTKEQLVNHTNGIAAELHTQIQEAEHRLTDRISSMEKRLVLQGGLVQSGSRALARFIEWTEKTDGELLRYEERITLLEKRGHNPEGHNSL
jgi:chromosome segregation ATPase